MAELEKTDALDAEIEIDDDEEEDLDYADEHQVFQNVLTAYEEAKTKREKYKKYGPIVILITGIVFLVLMFTLDTKIEFLILWVITAFYTAAVMIRAEYKYHKFRVILGLDKPDEEPEEEDEEEEEE